MGSDERRGKDAGYREYMKRKKQKRRIRSAVMLTVSAVFITAAVAVAVKIHDAKRPIKTTDRSYVSTSDNSNTGSRPSPSEDSSALQNKMLDKLSKLTVPDYVTQNILEVGKARRGLKLEGIKNIVIHYTGNPGTTAKQNRSFFAQPGTEVCSHFVVGIDGEIIQCVPLDEQSAASNWRNCDTISIEVCHKKADGKFSSEAYASVVKLTAWLCSELDLSEKDVIRHHDITGKDCPLYYVKHPDEWEKLKSDVASKIAKR